MTLNFPNLRIPASVASPSRDSSRGVSERGDAEKISAERMTDLSQQDSPLTLSLAAQDALQTQTKRFADMQNALDKLQAMPSSKISSKRAATERAEMLKQRLEMMRQMLLGATPEQAKAMAAQLKSIAKELASLGANLSGTQNTSTPMISQGSAPPTQSDSVSLENTHLAALSPSTTEDQTTTIPTDSNHHSKTTTETPPARTSAASKSMEEPLSGRAQRVTAAYTQQESSGEQKSGENNSGEKGADTALKKSLQEASSALRSLISMLKQRLDTSNKDLKTAESLNADIEKLISNTDIPIPDSTVSAGINVNISA